MIRLLIVSLLSKSDNSQQQLLAFATEAMETFRRETSLVLEKEHRNLAVQEAVFQEVVRRDVQRVTKDWSAKLTGSLSDDRGTICN